MPRKLLNSELPRLTPQDFKAAEKAPIVLLLDNVRSQHNIGAAFRTADAFRIAKIYLCGICAVPPGAEIHKAALGAEDTVDWQYEQHVITAIVALKQEGYTLIAVEQAENSVALHDFKPEKDKKYALVFGNEVKGVQQQVVDNCDFVLEIPQWGTKHSLNVSVSIGVILWDIVAKLR
ncbi:MAG: RNA methyltransferase [Bacteroidales bacterium]|nr:RNA methyltransferase [Bacteroidales bacterium]MCL2133401.1 RNA methyltransferase [Bacteroidales bacterium]